MLDEVDVKFLNFDIFRVERAWTILHLHGETVEMLQQIFGVVGDEVDQVDCQGFIGGDGFGFVDHGFGELQGILSARRYEGTDGSFDELFGFFIGCRVEVFARTGDGAGCSNGGFGCHGGGVPCHGDHGSGAPGNGVFR